MKYIVNEACIGCGMCTRICPDVFKMDNGFADAKDADVPLDSLEAAAKAKTLCPVSAIKEA